jgi:hypothetical protein
MFARSCCDCGAGVAPIDRSGLRVGFVALLVGSRRARNVFFSEERIGHEGHMYQEAAASVEDHRRA